MGAKNLEAVDTQAIYRVETVPPPEGEDDAYGAITKVGSFSTGQIAELMERADGPVSGVHSKADLGVEMSVELVDADFDLETEEAPPSAVDVPPVALQAHVAAPVPTGPSRALVGFLVGGFVAVGGALAALAYVLLG